MKFYIRVLLFFGWMSTSAGCMQKADIAPDKVTQVARKDTIAGKSIVEQPVANESFSLSPKNYPNCVGVQVYYGRAIESVNYLPNWPDSSQFVKIFVFKSTTGYRFYYKEYGGYMFQFDRFFLFNATNYYDYTFDHLNDYYDRFTLTDNELIYSGFRRGGCVDGTNIDFDGKRIMH